MLRPRKAADAAKRLEWYVKTVNLVKAKLENVNQGIVLLWALWAAGLGRGWGGGGVGPFF